MRRSRATLLAATVTALAVALTGCVFLPAVVADSRAGGDTDASISHADAPRNMGVGGVTYTADGVLRTDEPPALSAPAETDAIEVSLVFDAMCPHCAQFEATYAETIHELVDSGDITFTVYPVSFVAPVPSKRSANAFIAVATYHPDAVREFQDLLLAANLDSGGAGLQEAELIALAADAGASSPELEEAIEAQQFMEFADELNSSLLGSEFPGSSVLVSGTPLLIAEGLQIDVATFSGTADDALDRLKMQL